MNKVIPILMSFFISCLVQAQELNARVTVSASQVTNNVNRSAFLTLQTALNNLLNTRKWTKDAYAPNEKIDCTFFLNLQSTEEANIYKGSLTIQAARPVFNTSYLSPIINFKDDDINFEYVEFQQLEFNENRVSGNDAQISNLTAIFAYYVNMIIAFDNESFAIRGGEASFLKAQNIVNNAPDGRGIRGWKAFDGIRNRFWLVDNMLNTRFAVMNDIYYNYYRLGLDKFYEDENAGRAEILNSLNLLSVFNNENSDYSITNIISFGRE